MTGPGHGDHWFAALEPGDARLTDALTIPPDAPDGIALHRRPLTAALDLVQVTARRRLITAYPEPRATTLLSLRPRELALWETRVEGWLVAEHEGAGALTLFLTDLVEHPDAYEKASRTLDLEVCALAYSVQPSPIAVGATRLSPARKKDERFLPDDYSFDALVRAAQPTEEDTVLDLEFQNGLVVPVTVRGRPRVEPGDRAKGFLWLTARVPKGH